MTKANFAFTFSSQNPCQSLFSYKHGNKYPNRYLLLSYMILNIALIYTDLFIQRNILSQINIRIVKIFLLNFKIKIYVLHTFHISPCNFEVKFSYKISPMSALPYYGTGSNPFEYERI